MCVPVTQVPLLQHIPLILLFAVESFVSSVESFVSSVEAIVSAVKAFVSLQCPKHSLLAYLGVIDPRKY